MVVENRRTWLGWRVVVGAKVGFRDCWANLEELHSGALLLEVVVLPPPLAAFREVARRKLRPAMALIVGVSAV